LKVPWTGTWALIAPNFLKLGGKELIAGVMAVTSYTTDQSANAKALHEKMERVFKDQGGDFYPVGTAQTYDGVRLVLRALDKVGPDPQKIRDALEEIDDFTEAVTKMKPHPFSRQNHESLGRDTGLDQHKTAAVSHEVQQWRESSKLPFPDYAPADISEFSNSLPYPQPESALRSKK